MRLICPNCDAQYEVPDEVIPTSGRDVQCSSCGQTWFQHHRDHLSEDETDEDPAPAEPAPVPPPPPQSPAPKEPARKQLDPGVTDILRQEAQAEQDARRKRQSEPLESQPELGLGTADDTAETQRRAREARDRMARMRGDKNPSEPVTVEATPASISSRRDLLPDIEEINSTLRTGDNGASRSTRSAPDAAPEQGGRAGFRTGFLLMLVVFALLSGLYIYAPQIAKAAPGMDPYLSGYVGWVDGLRIWLDSRVQGILMWLDAKASETA